MGRGDPAAIGADCYAKDAMDAVRYAQSWEN
jgi:methanogenic corrinoid protein MtbC1